jgi:citrate lyase subunit beta/citryl-CoA lyase
MLAKAAALPADMVFLDLEDAVAPLEKNDATRQNVVDALTSHGWTAPTRVVRVNGIDTAWCFRDILYVVEGSREALDCIMLPKVQGPDHVAFAHHLLTQLEAELGMHKRIGLEIQIESARGAENLPAIADASDRIETIIFGPGDYAADLGIPQLSVGAVDEVYPGDQWHSIVSRIVITARARGLQSSTARTPPSATSTASAWSRSARCASAATASGHCIRPDRDPERGLRPSQAQFERAEALLAAYRQATEDDRRGADVGGRDDRRGLIKMAEQIAARGRASA